MPQPHHCRTIPHFRKVDGLCQVNSVESWHIFYVATRANFMGTCPIDIERCIRGRAVVWMTPIVWVIWRFRSSCLYLAFIRFTYSERIGQSIVAIYPCSFCHSFFVRLGRRLGDLRFHTFGEYRLRPRLRFCNNRDAGAPDC
jgi:hypothetical protein